eukprot:scaffold109578_cov63-Phaeocystis_antarctica.AAC.2
MTTRERLPPRSEVRGERDRHRGGSGCVRRRPSAELNCERGHKSFIINVQRSRTQTSRAARAGSASGESYR